MQSPVLRLVTGLPKVLRRNFGVTGVVQADAIQKLFVDKIKEYASKSQDGKLVDVTPEIQKELESELKRVERLYGVKADEMGKFPKLNFAEPKLDPISVKDN